MNILKNICLDISLQEKEYLLNELGIIKDKH